MGMDRCASRTNVNNEKHARLASIPSPLYFLRAKIMRLIYNVSLTTIPTVSQIFIYRINYDNGIFFK